MTFPIPQEVIVFYKKFCNDCISEKNGDTIPFDLFVDAFIYYFINKSYNTFINVINQYCLTRIIINHTIDIENNGLNMIYLYECFSKYLWHILILDDKKMNSSNNRKYLLHYKLNFPKISKNIIIKNSDIYSSSVLYIKK